MKKICHAQGFFVMFKNIQGSKCNFRFFFSFFSHLLSRCFFPTGVYVSVLHEERRTCDAVF